MERKKAKKKRIHEPYTKFKGWLVSKSLKYEDIAETLGLTVSTVSQKINGYSDFMMHEVENIISEYDATYDIFCAEVAKKKQINL